MPENVVDILVTTPGVLSKLLTNSKLSIGVHLCSLMLKFCYLYLLNFV